MIELLILMASARFLRSWLQAPIDQDCEEWIVMNEMKGGED